MNKITVIIPAYNSELYIEKCIGSVLRQTEQNFEILIIDDCSQDNTVLKINKFSDKRIQLIKNIKNEGPSFCRNIGIEQASGKWLAFLDADDCWMPYRLERLISLAEKKQADIIADDLIVKNHGISTWNETVLSKRDIKIDSPVNISLDYFINKDLGILKTIIRQQFIKESGVRFDKSIRIGEDFVFLLFCLLNGAKFILIPEAYYCYNLNKNSLTARRIDLFKAIFDSTNILLQNQIIQNNSNVYAALKKRMNYAENALNYNQFKNAINQNNYSHALKEAYRTPAIILFVLRQLIRKYGRN